ncbi:MAG: transposase [Actinobacteria bacterium]|nr:transposase [Actinomycetota bacterium]
MTRIPRSLLPDGTYHAMSRGVARSTIFRDQDDRQLFLRLLLKVVERWSWEFHALCLMGNHYHFVIDASREALSAGMHRLNGVYAHGFNDRYNRSGHLFGDRFVCRVVEGDDYLHDLCRYVLGNPVRAGLCERAQDWPWSWSRYGFDEG